MQGIDLMCEAYKCLYQIEIKLRSIIKFNMTHMYGIHWKVKFKEKRSEDDAFYHELISYFGKYPQALPHFKTPELKKLQQLTPIRNKIAHSHLLTKEEFEFLQECYSLVIEKSIEAFSLTGNYKLDSIVQ